MSENLLKPIVFLVSFVGIAALLLSTMGNLQTVSEGGVSDTSIDFSLLEYTYWTPDTGWDVTWANATDLSPFDLEDVDFEFESPDTTDEMWTGSVRNSTEYSPGSTTWYEKYEDFITVSDSYFWGFNREVISYQTIDSAHDAAEWVNTNSTEISFIIGGYNMTVIITTPGEADGFSDSLWTNNTFNLRLAEVTVVGYSAEGDWLTLIYQLLFLQLPDVHWFINALMAIPFWIAIGFIAITLISRMLPDWISGG